MIFIKFVILCALFHKIYSFSYDIVFNKFDVLPETDLGCLDFGSLRILKRSRTEIEFSGKFYLFQKLTNVGMLAFTVFRLNTMGVPPLQVFFSNGGYCDQVGKDEYLYPNIVAHSDMPKEFCPLQPGNYTIKDLIIHMDKFKQVIPLGEYSGTMVYTINNKIKFGCKVTASIIKVDGDDD